MSNDFEKYGVPPVIYSGNFVAKGARGLTKSPDESPTYRKNKLTLDEFSNALLGFSQSAPVILGVRDNLSDQPMTTTPFEKQTYAVSLFNPENLASRKTRRALYSQGDILTIARDMKPAAMKFKAKTTEPPISFTVEKSPESFVWRAYLTFTD